MFSFRTSCGVTFSLRHFAIAGGLGVLLLILLPVKGQETESTGDVNAVFNNNSKPAVKVNVLAFTAQTPRVVPSDHPFKTGDHFRLRVELNRAGYVYLLNRTLVGAPDLLRSKGIVALQTEDAQAGHTGNEAYRLVYPTDASTILLSAAQSEDLHG